MLSTLDPADTHIPLAPRHVEVCTLALMVLRIGSQLACLLQGQQTPLRQKQPENLFVLMFEVLISKRRQLTKLNNRIAWRILSM